MNKPINLNQARKKRIQEDKRATANENALRFGLTKAERLQEAAQTEKAARMLDQHRFSENE